MPNQGERSSAPYPSSGGLSPRGGSFDSEYTTHHPSPQDSALPPGILNMYGKPADTNDPAYAPPYDPLKRGNPLRRAEVISREVPIIHVETGWTPERLRAATVEHIHGIFHESTQIVDTLVLTDSRVQSALSARSGGLLGQPLTFGMPHKFRKSKLARECLDVWRDHRPQIASEAPLSEFLTNRILLGFGQGQAIWQMGKYALPQIGTWNSRCTYFDFIVRRYINITLDGPDVVDPGDAHHLLYAPHGVYRGWMRGKAFSIINWWLSRQYALRDMSRYSERHGFPIITAISPMGADVGDINAFRDALATLGQESVVQLPQSLDPQIGKYALDYLEPKSPNYEVFRQLIDACNSEITLAILGQNLAGGSEVKEGSFAAARVHANVAQQLLGQDARSLALFIYQQLARPFAAINFGDPELAPWCEWNVDPVEDAASKAKVFVDVAMAINYARLAGIRFKNARRTFRKLSGVDPGPIEVVDPVQVESRLAAKTGEADETAEAPEGTRPGKPKKIGTKGAAE